MIHKKLIIFFMACASALLNGDTKIKMYVFYTPSHQAMFERWFLPSIQDDYMLVVEHFSQECATGNFMEKGWMDTMLHKVDLVIRGIQENMGSYFIHSDVDIQFFGPTQDIIAKEIQNKDLVLQRDSPNGGVCAGFFACKANEKTLALWQEVRAKVLSGTAGNDQEILNGLLQHETFDVTWSYLPDNFFGGGTFSGEVWQPGQTLTIPESPLMHHAHWTIGIENKIAQLEYVKARVVLSRFSPPSR